MIILRKLFSRHTPKKLKKYKEYKDEDLDNMTRGQKLRALEEEDETAAHNTQKYVNKKALKWGLSGAGAGAATLGAIAAKTSPKGSKLASTATAALTGTLAGGSLGTIIGAERGAKKATKEGHNRDKRTTKLARRMDDRARTRGQEDDYEYQNNSRIKSRKAEEEARAARQMATATYINTL